MAIKPLAELQEPDETTQRFGPMGLETGRVLVAEDAAIYQQEVISGADLVPAVAASIGSADDEELVDDSEFEVA